MSAEGPLRRAGQLVVGRLMEHGHASYEFQRSQDPSYYLKILTNRGIRTLWGKDLERALKDAKTQPEVGDLVGARRVSREVVHRTQSEVRHRVRWEVEKAKYFSDAARRARVVRDTQTDARQAVRAHPELKSSFLSLRSAEELAARRIENPEDRKRFLELVREAMAGSIQRGEPLPEVRIREKPAADKNPETEKEPAPRGRDRDEPTR